MPRVLDGVLGARLESAGAVVIEGPRACGKTMTALNICNSYVFLDDPAARDLVSIAPDQLLLGARPRLLDEWQLAPELWNRVRRHVDFSRDPGQFVLTGSAVPSVDATRHTGAGRFLRVRQHTLSWWERGASSGTVSLAGLFAGERPAPFHEQLPYSAVVQELVRPGFPAMLELEESRAHANLRGYLEEVSRADIGLLADVRHSPAAILQLVRALARSLATEVTLSALAADLQRIAPGIHSRTVGTYVELLERLFVVDRQGAWTPSLRSRARLRTSDKLHLADPSLAAVAMGVDSAGLARDPETVGLLFESAVFHDLSVLAAPLEGSVRHYRDSNGHEIDAVVVLPDGRWGAVEVKVGGGQLPRGAASLASAVEQIETKPEFRLVLTGTGGTYVLDDGTISCSLAHLRP
ncbi:MAG: DUF4143 domain-containing protein [bacterium]|nr:DUF4143 domain-containing protein [bacterium]